MEANTPNPKYANSPEVQEMFDTVSYDRPSTEEGRKLAAAEADRVDREDE